MIRTSIFLQCVLITVLLANTACGSPAVCNKCDSAKTKNTEKIIPEIITGANQIPMYINYLKGKNIGMVVNQTSVIGKTLTPSVDSLLKAGITVKKIFGPEHGFRGNASNGATVNDATDTKTG